jgi:hypothetical protein
MKKKKIMNEVFLILYLKFLSFLNNPYLENERNEVKRIWGSRG